MAKKRERIMLENEEERKLLDKYEKIKRKIRRLGKDSNEVLPSTSKPSTEHSSIMADFEIDADTFEDPNEANKENDDPIVILDPDNLFNVQELEKPDNMEFDCLDEDILKVLGKDPKNMGILKMDWHPSINSRWKYWTESGLQKQDKIDLLDKYERKSPFEAPKLNREIMAVLKDHNLKKDKYFSDQQNQVGTALASLGLALTQLLKDEDQLDKLVLLERLSDAGKILSNLHFELAKARKAFITPGLNKNLKVLLTEKKTDEWLFGEKLADNRKFKLQRPVCKEKRRSNGLELEQVSPLIAEIPEQSKQTFQQEQDTSKDSLQQYKLNVRVTADPVILSYIEGYKLNFVKPPIGYENFLEPKRSELESEEIKTAITSLIDKGVIIQCNFCEGQFLSSYFVVPKASGGKRFILNLKKLNNFMDPEHFKMEDVRAAIRLVNVNYFMSAIDLKDAYYTVPIHEESRKFLRFQFQGMLFEFVCLPFGLCTAPFIFTKIMKPVIARLREKEFMSVIYLDDILCIGKDEINCIKNVRETINLVESLGFSVNYKKSALQPTQRCKFLGFFLNSSSMQLELTEEKKLKIKELTKNYIQKSQCSIREFAHLLGLLVAASQAVKYAWVYIKSLERTKYLELLKNNQNYDKLMYVPTYVKEDLQWWQTKIMQASNSMIRDKFDIVVFTDASLSGWGADCNGEQIHGIWSDDERRYHINYLELLAVYKVLSKMVSLVSSKNVLLRIDNRTAIAYINKMGGVKFKDLNMLARKLWKWAEYNQVWMFASYIPSKENTVADRLSRVSNVDIEWELSDTYFGRLVNIFGYPDIDLFASERNTKCEQYCVWYPEENAVAIDAFTISWKHLYFYAFPPFSMILRMLMENTPIIEIDEVNCLEGIRRSFLNDNIGSDTVNILFASLADGTRRQYDTSLKKWREFCIRNGKNPFKESTTDILKFLTEEFNKGNKLSVNNVLSRFMKGVYKLRPCKARYEYIWDVSEVLEKLKEWFPLEDLSVQDLTEKVVLLLALASGHRVQTLAAINIDNVKISSKEVVIRIPKLLKTSAPGKLQPLITLPFYFNNPELCVASCIVKYLEVTSVFRGEIKEFFITCKKPFKQASSQTISRWIKLSLAKCGVDISIFKAHSTRHASTSSALARGIDVESIRKMAEWVLPKFTKFNLLFQAEKVIIPLLYNQAAELFKDILICYMDNSYVLNTNVKDIDPDNELHFLPINEIYLGLKVNTELQKPEIIQQADHVENFRMNTFNILKEASKELQKRFDFNDLRLRELECFIPHNAIDRQFHVTIPTLTSIFEMFPRNLDSSSFTSQSVDDEWRLLGFAQLPLNITNEKLIDVFWVKLLNYEDVMGLQKYKSLSQFVLNLLCLPHSNAECERLFSKVNLTKTKNRNKMKTTTLKSNLTEWECVKNNGTCKLFEPSADMIDHCNQSMYNFNTSNTDHENEGVSDEDSEYFMLM
ncbi:uncharacterized protein [Prorops nasuta]|uniref:uncharacterized protein n=1 Tax=Prorops nasuta TaxID=863751 RepID=UPI0034CFDAA4